jgi:hypothetical protein
VTEQVQIALWAVLSLSIFLLSHFVLRKLGRKIGGQTGRRVAPLFRRVVTIYYRRKVIRQMQADRKAKGLPPIENPYTR